MSPLLSLLTLSSADLQILSVGEVKEWSEKFLLMPEHRCPVAAIVVICHFWSDLVGIGVSGLLTGLHLQAAHLAGPKPCS